MYFDAFVGGSDFHILLHHLDSAFEHVFMCLLAISIFPWGEKCLLGTFAHIKLGCTLIVEL